MGGIARRREHACRARRHAAKKLKPALRIRP
jgi:hypothetical protein